KIFKKRIVFLLPVFLLCWFGDAVAQKPAAGKTIFDFRKELNLTDEQVRRIREHISIIERETASLRAKLTISDIELQKLIEKEEDMVQIRLKIRETFNIQAEIRIIDIETVRDIDRVLTPTQLIKWRKIKADLY
ncbi:MAG: hypothetical protein Q7K21_06030, partial [Elusimicrobiota bacterium]|nr:hypothetical protein [Elusimicrobiota bacterium]